MPGTYKRYDQNDVVDRIAGEDLRRSQYRALVRNANGEVVRSGANGDIYGLLENDPNVGMDASVVVSAPAFPCISGGAFPRDAKLRSDAQARLVQAAAGEAYYYRAEEAATAADQAIPVRRETGRVPAA